VSRSPYGSSYAIDTPHRREIFSGAARAITLTLLRSRHVATTRRGDFGIGAAAALPSAATVWCAAHAPSVASSAAANRCPAQSWASGNVIGYSACCSANGIHMFLEILLCSKARNSMIIGLYFEFAFFMLAFNSPRDTRQYTDGNFCLRENQWAKTSNRWCQPPLAENALPGNSYRVSKRALSGFLH
jgi:hypothetical protein